MLNSLGPCWPRLFSRFPARVRRSAIFPWRSQPLWSWAALCAAVKAFHEQPSADILEGVLERLRAHVGKTKMHDDISLMVVKQR